VGGAEPLRAPATVLMVVVTGTLAGGCSLTGPAPAPSPSTPSTPRSSVPEPRGENPGAHASPRLLRPVSKGPASSAQAVLYRYAGLWGNLCACSHAPETLKQLESLATPQLAAKLSRAAARARAALAHGLRDQAQAVGHINTVELAPAKHGTQTGLVVLLEQTFIHRRAFGPPTPMSYTVKLTRTPAGWRVASFTAVPPAHCTQCRPAPPPPGQLTRSSPREWEELSE